MNTTTRNTRKAWWLAALMFVFGLNLTNAQVLLNETFDYTTGSLLTENGWTAHSGGGTNPLTVLADPLTLAGYAASGQGKSVGMVASGEDANRTFEQRSSGTVVAAMLVNVTDAGTNGDYFFHMSNNPFVGGNFYARTYVRGDGDGKLAFGVSKTGASGTINYTDHNFDKGTTYLLVVTYTFVDGDANDMVQLGVMNADGDTIGSVESTGGNDAADIGSVALRQGTASNNVVLTIGGMRVGTDAQAVILGDTPETVKVTFRVNASTINDTLKTTDNMFIRGAFKSPATAEEWTEGDYNGTNISWGTTAPMTNVGGDYWELEVTAKPGDAIQWKYFPQFENGENLNIFDGGWEAGDPRVVVVPAQDVVLPLGFWNNGNTAPFTTYQDSVTLYFRVNVAGFAQGISTPIDEYVVDIRGDGAAFNNWGSAPASKKLTRIGDTPFFAGAIRYATDYEHIGTDKFWKFVIEAGGNVYWDYLNNDAGADAARMLNMPAADKTIGWVYFRDQAPTAAELFDVEMDFVVSVGILEGLGLFNSGLDQVLVRGGFNGWGDGDNAQMSVNQFIGAWQRTGVDFRVPIGATTAYKYFVLWDASRFVVGGDNYLAGIEAGNGWEEPASSAGGDRIYRFTSAPEQTTGVQNFNDIAPEALITAENTTGGSIDVTLRFDMSPARNYTDRPFNADTDEVFVLLDDAFFALTQGFRTAGDNNSNFLAGTAEEKAKLIASRVGETFFYEITWTLQLPTLNNFAFRIGYSNLDNENDVVVSTGNGSFGPGRRTYRFIPPQFNEFGEVVWPSSVTLQPVRWTAPGTNAQTEEPPKYDPTATSTDREVTTPKDFVLNQNYPNPFNPSTTISFNLPQASNVTLTVYNVLGQRVATLVNNAQYGQGTHSVSFDASRLSSGMYLYRLEAGGRVAQKKMMLVK